MRLSPRTAPTRSPWLTVSEAAALLGRSDQTIRSCLRTGSLSGHYVTPRALRIHRAEVERLRDEIQCGVRSRAPDSPCALRVFDFERRAQTTESRAAAYAEMERHRQRLEAIRAAVRGHATREQLDLLVGLETEDTPNL